MPDIVDLLPYLHVADVERSLVFYALLGFEVHARVVDDEGVAWARLHSHGAGLMVARADAPFDPGAQAVLLYLYAQNLEATRDRLIAAGLAPGPIEAQAAAPRRMRLDDPDGYGLLIAAPV